MDNNIIFDEKSIEYIIKNKCDKLGQLNYMQVLKDLVIKTETETSGKLISKWSMRQCIRSRDDSSTKSSKPPISTAKKLKRPASS